jgi:hypothetical protein
MHGLIKVPVDLNTVNDWNKSLTHHFIKLVLITRNYSVKIGYQNIVSVLMLPFNQRKNYIKICK